jgi:hypothetical protein
MIFSECIYAFVWISDHAVIISLYNINWLVSITERKSVYWVVRNESLRQVYGNAKTLFLCSGS